MIRIFRTAVFAALIVTDYAFLFHGSTRTNQLCRGKYGVSARVASSMSPSRVSISTIKFEEEDDDDGGNGESEYEQTIPSGDVDFSVIGSKINLSQPNGGSDVRVGVIMDQWHAEITQRLYKGVNESLTLNGVKSSNVFATKVPSSFDLPITAKLLAASKRVDVIIALGCLIKGTTGWSEHAAQAIMNGLMQVSLDTLVPCIPGILTVSSKQQAVTRSSSGCRQSNMGLHYGRAAVEMGLHRMAALGMGKRHSQGKGDSGSGVAPFVTFRGPLPVTPAIEDEGDGKNAPVPTRKVGF